MMASMTYGLAWIRPDSGQQRDAVAEREQADVENDVLQFVEEENHTDQKRQVIVAGDHVLGAEVKKRGNRGAFIGLTKLASRFETLWAAGNFRKYQGGQNQGDGNENSDTAARGIGGSLARRRR